MIVSFRDLGDKYEHFSEWLTSQVTDYCFSYQAHIPPRDFYELIAHEMGGEFLLVEQTTTFTDGKRTMFAVDIEEAALALFLLRLL